MDSPLVCTVVGARPQFVKAAQVSSAFREQGIYEIIIHTGQHYDQGLSGVFFDSLDIPAPAENLGVGSGSHARQTGEMLIKLEAAYERHTPKLVVVHGDTNSTLAAALAAVKLGIPVAHNEAGMRSYNREMPEEHNRVLTDHCSEYHFTPTLSAAENLKKEDITSDVYVVGDVMYDSFLMQQPRFPSLNDVLPDDSYEPGGYVLLTVHRPSVVDSRERLSALIQLMGFVDLPVLFPIHPRTKNALERHEYELPSHVRVLPPVGYLEMMALERDASYIVTDSGGVQKEAYFHGVSCITLRAETEWRETVDTGWNTLTDLDEGLFRQAIASLSRPSSRPQIFGNGEAAKHIARIVKEILH